MEREDEERQQKNVREGSEGTQPKQLLVKPAEPQTISENNALQYLLINISIKNVTV